MRALDHRYEDACARRHTDRKTLHEIRARSRVEQRGERDPLEKVVGDDRHRGCSREIVCNRRDEPLKELAGRIARRIRIAVKQGKPEIVRQGCESSAGDGDRTHDHVICVDHKDRQLIRQRDVFDQPRAGREVALYVRHARESRRIIPLDLLEHRTRATSLHERQHRFGRGAAPDFKRHDLLKQIGRVVE
jgi:hypothetical protein